MLEENEFSEDYNGPERRQGWQDLRYDIKYIKREIEELHNDFKDLKNDYIGRKEFEQRVGRLEKFFYGVIAFMGLGVGGALLALILKQ